MKLYEYEAKNLFESANIMLPQRRIISTPLEAQQAVEDFGCPVVLKVQILSGGRGKAGGIKFANTPQEAKKVAKGLLGSTIKGYNVTKLLVEEQLSIQQEIYMGVTVDREARRFVAIISQKGGIDIEEVAETDPDSLMKTYLDPEHGLTLDQAQLISEQAGFRGDEIAKIADFLYRLWKVTSDYDIELAEINPLIKTDGGEFIAADARIVVDDNAIFRHTAFKERLQEGATTLTPLELKARNAGMAYVELDGDIGIIGNGAGLVMATMDTIHLFGGKPANFLDVGGGAAADRMELAIDIISKNPHVRMIFINIMAGITRCDEMAQGILKGIKNRPDLQLVIRLVGTREKEGRGILESAGIKVFDSMDAAAQVAVQLLSGEA